MAVGAGLAISALSSLGSALFKGISGRKQRKEAAQIRAENKRPLYEIPKEAKESLQIYKTLGTQGLPYKDIMQEKLGQQTAGAIRGIQETGQDASSRLAALGGIYDTQLEGFQDIEMADMEQRIANQRMLATALGQFADYRDTEFEINKMQPYMEAAQAAQALEGAGRQNIAGALDEALGGIGEAGAAMAGGLGGGEETRQQDLLRALSASKTAPNRALATDRRTNVAGIDLSKISKDELNALIMGLNTTFGLNLSGVGIKNR